MPAQTNARQPRYCWQYTITTAALICALPFAYTSAYAQEGTALPPVKVIQTAPKAAKPKKKAEKPKAPAPQPLPPQEAPAGDVVYSANRTPTDASKVGSSVSVITQKDIAARSQPFVQDYLQTVPGMSVSQAGPAGSQTTVMLRGANAQYLKVLVDGMDISDPSATQTLPLFEHILAGDASRIEVLKGSQSMMYGGNAVGGVIVVDTKPSGPGFSESGSIEHGSYNTTRGDYTMGYGGERGNFSATVQGITSDGFPALDGGHVNNDYENVTVSTRGDYRVSDAVKVFFAARAYESDLRIPSYQNVYPYALVDGPANSRAKTMQEAGRTGTEIALLNGAFVNTFAIQSMALRREYAEYGSWYDGSRVKGEYMGVMKFNDAFSVIAGADRETNSAETSYNPQTLSTWQNGVFAQANLEPVKGLALSAGGRIDDHSAFGEFDTYRLTGTYVIPGTGTRPHASLGTGFRVPSLYELYDPYSGSAKLTPETSKSWDAGVEQKFWNGRITADVTYFVLDTENLINFDLTTYRYLNVPGLLHREGVETSVKTQVTERLAILTGYTYTDAHTADGARFVRVPRNMASFGVDAQLTEKLRANVMAKVVTDTVDTSSHGLVGLEDYLLVNAKLSYAIKPGLTAYIRGENLLDQHYETVYGYGTPGLSVYGGLSFKFAEGK
jgi:vitamin B12 transporter